MEWKEERESVLYIKVVLTIQNPTAFTSGVAENTQTWAYPCKYIENLDIYLKPCRQRELEFESWIKMYNVSDLEQFTTASNSLFAKRKS